METEMNPEISKKYVKLDQKEHLLRKPDMYIGSMKADYNDMWVLNDCDNEMKKNSVHFIQGLLSIFNEIISNAIDQFIRLEEQIQKGATNIKKVTTIKVNIDKDTGVISVYNDGEGIEIVLHPEHKIYVPELIFGNLLTSSNYDVDQTRIVQGTNGIGCKACNIMSEYFTVETHDKTHVYKQTFRNNMNVAEKPHIKKATTKTPYTVITFKPDYLRFGIPSLTEDMFKVMKKRTFDICAVVSNKVKVFFNEKLIEYSSFTKYVDLYLGGKKEHERVAEIVNDRWEVIASYSDFDGFEQVSFVNGLLTINGGTHVKYILDQICKHITTHIKTKHKIDVKPQSIKDNLILFIKCVIDNPTFNSQTKESLTTPANLFGSTPKLSDVFLRKLCNTDLINKIVNISTVNEEKILKKTDGKKNSIIRGIPKLEDAIWAGTAKSSECILILTEGDSAASMALAGLSEVGRERYGVFPLKGKVMNVKDIAVKKIAENDEINNIKKILGLESGKEYNDTNGLRYGKIMLMTDSDCDGTHIKGLIFNLFHSLWPSLLKIDKNFIVSMLTPIIKVKKGSEQKSFYNMTSYENWCKTLRENELKTWKVKYYKGLGTSTNQEAKEYFKEMKTIDYDFADDSTLDLAFNKKKANDRKSWLSCYDRQNIIDYTCTKVTCEEFINKDFIHFSNYDIERSIPSICDGLKISQRKILYSCILRNLFKEELRVSQLAGYVSVDSAYHHGEASLQAAIVGLAQDFVGSNNINLLLPNGQFGSRVHGGKDAGQPRYIHTQLSPIVNKLFIKQDSAILENVEDNGLVVEPLYYIPVIPMVLVNGACGIGTGFSTSIPCYNPTEIIDELTHMINNNGNCSNKKLIPFYRKFRGNIAETSDKKFVSVGCWKKIKNNQIKITELPIGTWTMDYKEDLETLLDKLPYFKKYENKSAEHIDIDLFFNTDVETTGLMEIESNGFRKFENLFKLVSTKGLGITNMYLFNGEGRIKKYDGVKAILKDFYKIRLDFYQKRKESILKDINKELDILKNKLRFVKQVVANEIDVTKMNKDQLIKRLEDNKYLLINESYDYLTRIPIYNFTKDKVQDLQNEVNIQENNLKKTNSATIQDMWLEDLQELLKVYFQTIDM